MAANHALVEARTKARLSQRDLAMKVREAGKRLGVATGCNATTVGRWETGEAVPQPRMLACLEAALGVPAEKLGFGEGPSISWLAPPSFPANALCGAWVTSYQFPHGGQQFHHADIAHITADGDGHIRATNDPARTEGRAVPFHNEIDAQLSSRHLIGHWRNTSDTRYFGTVHLAVLQGETVMDGYYSGFESDISVSFSRWRWVRLDPNSLEGTDLSAVGLREPSIVYDLVMGRSQYDAPLTLADVEES